MIAVVGAGIIGCAIARELARRGAACTVLDPRPVAGGATQASAGMLAPYVEAHDARPLLELGLRSLALYKTLLEALGVERFDVEHAWIPTLEVALSTGRAAALRSHHGVWIEPDAVARLLPDLCATSGALRNDAHGYVDAPQLARAFAGSAEGHGAQFRQTRVRAMEPHGAGIRLRLDDGAMDAARVVLAAGAWTNQIAGIALPPLRPVRGQLLNVRWPRPLPAILWSTDCYIVPRANGTMLVGATVEEAGFDERTTGEGVRGLLEAARALLPALSSDALIDARVGLRPATPDDLPVLGVDPRLPALVHASGHYRNGVLLAPITAALIADLVLDNRVDPSLAPFRPDRFSMSHKP